MYGLVIRPHELGRGALDADSRSSWGRVQEGGISDGFVIRPHGCPCGFLGHPKKDCHCTPRQVRNYLSKISGPLLDRIDIHVEVPAIEYHELRSGLAGESSVSIREQIVRARAMQTERFQGLKVNFNAHMSTRHLKKFCALDAEAEAVLELAMQELALSARAHHKIIRVARTIADLEGAQSITAAHLSEAVQYRNLDRQMWM